MSEEQVESVVEEVVTDSTEETPQQEEVLEASPEVEGEATEVEEVPEELLEIVIDGQTMQVSMEELKNGYQKASASAKRFQEASAKAKEVEAYEAKTREWEQKLLNNPYEALKSAGIPDEDIRKHYEDIVYQWLKLDAMSEDEKVAMRQQRETEAKLKEYEEMKLKMEELERSKEQQAYEAQVAQQQEEMANQINEALDRNGVPNSPAAIKRVAEMWGVALSTGSDINLDSVVTEFKASSSSSLQEMLSSMDEDSLLSLIGEERMSKIRKKDLAKIKNPVSAREMFPEPSKESEEITASAKDFFASLK